ncbi:DJ-1 family glyoxalase III [Mordavella massiliensis]|uniref:DJ-1/PfpI family protein n=1 Tax=Mordavella massiliensis TaxID=1871024 RepID=A0A938XB38_9CLOT|nr:DJ-1 family glyoxalase III [Mordavella massiliensis]MBM6948241.1 DJ-1/PfpI family protein [Mordavella massiliensis]
MKKAAVLLADGFEEIEALTAVDLLRRARIYVDTISISDDYMVNGSHGINVQTEDLFAEVDFGEFDMLVLPGGMPGTANLDAHDGVRRVVREFCEKGKYVGAICAAPSILGNMGLLKGKRGTCFPAFEDRMSGAVLVKAPVVQDGNIITSRGMGTAIEFGLKLVEVLTDKAKADEIAQSIIYLK